MRFRPIVLRGVAPFVLLACVVYAGGLVSGCTDASGSGVDERSSRFDPLSGARSFQGTPYAPIYVRSLAGRDHVVFMRIDEWPWSDPVADHEAMRREIPSVGPFLQSPDARHYTDESGVIWQPLSRSSLQVWVTSSLMVPGQEDTRFEWDVEGSTPAQSWAPFALPCERECTIHFRWADTASLGWGGDDDVHRVNMWEDAPERWAYASMQFESRDFLSLLPARARLDEATLEGVCFVPAIVLDGDTHEASASVQIQELDYRLVVSPVQPQRRNVDWNSGRDDFSAHDAFDSLPPDPARWQDASR